MHALINRSVSKVQTLLLDDEWTAHDTLIDAEDIFSQKPDEKDLYRAEEQHADQHRRHAGRETVPPDELHDEVNDRDDHGNGAADTTGKHSDPEADLRIGGEAEHCRIVERVKIVVCDTGTALRLSIWDLLPMEAKLCHDTPEKWRRIIECAHDIDEGMVIETEAGELLDLIDGGPLLDGL